jgi:DNA-binding PadR family transcriptional regulator
VIGFALLGLLRERGDYGYQLRRRLERRLGPAWKLNVGQVYATLRGLERQGLIVVEREISSGTRVQRVLAITPKGLRALDRWVRKGPPPDRRVRDGTLVWLWVARAVQPRSASLLLASEVAGLERELDRLCAVSRKLGATRPGYGRPRRLALQGALLHGAARLAWLSACQAAVSAEPQPAPPVVEAGV